MVVDRFYMGMAGNVGKDMKVSENFTFAGPSRRVSGLLSQRKTIFNRQGTLVARQQKDRDSDRQTYLLRSVILNTSTILSRAILSIAVLTASAAGATPLTWTLQGVTYEDGATASGAFVIESTTGDILSWDITTTPGLLEGFHYDLSSSSLFARDFFGAPNSYTIVRDTPFAEPYINLTFASALTAPGTVNFVTSQNLNGSWECINCDLIRYVTAGGVTTNPVPEPAPVALLGIALAALLARRKRRT